MKFDREYVLFLSWYFVLISAGLLAPFFFFDVVDFLNNQYLLYLA